MHSSRRRLTPTSSRRRTVNSRRRPNDNELHVYQRQKVRVDSYPYPVKEGHQYINFKHGRLFVQQPSKRERDREAHLNYYASAYNRGRHLSHRKTKLNQINKLTKYQNKS